MAFPAPADWSSNALFAAYFFESDKLQQTDGASFLSDLSQELRVLRAAVPMRDTYGVAITDADIPLANAWDQALLRLLHAAASALRAPREYVDAIATDAAENRVSVSTLQAAIWVTYTNQRQTSAGGRTTTSYGFGSPADIKISESSIMPQFGVAIPPGPGGIRSGLTSAIVPASAQPPALDPRVRETGGSLVVALLFVSAIAVVGGLAMSTVKSKPYGKRVRRNPSDWMLCSA